MRQTSDLSMIALFFRRFTIFIRKEKSTLE